MTTNNPIIEKIKKLLALANDAGATEGERDNALRMAHGLLAKHNLDMADVQASQQQEGRENYVNATFGMVWCRRVSNAVAELFFCKYYFGKKINGTKMEHHFVGKSSNATTAALMSEFIISSILSECRKRWKHNLAPEARAFALGASARIRERVDALIANPVPDGATGTSLVVAGMYKTEADANEMFLQQVGVSLVKAKSRNTSVNAAAYGAGKAYGNSIGLNNQVGGKSHLRLK